MGTRKRTRSMARGQMILGVLAVLLLLSAMGTGLGAWSHHQALGITAALVSVAVPLPAWLSLRRLDRRSGTTTPLKIPGRLAPFAYGQIVLVGLTNWLGSATGPLGWFHGLLGGLSTGFAMVLTVVAWASVIARIRALPGRCP